MLWYGTNQGNKSHCSNRLSAVVQAMHVNNNFAEIVELISRYNNFVLALHILHKSYHIYFCSTTIVYQ